MRKLFALLGLFAALLTATPASAQLNSPLGLVVFGGKAAATCPAQALAYFAALSPQPSAGRKTLLCAYVAGLISDGVYSDLDWVLPLFDENNATNALVDLVQPSKSAANTGSLTFTVNRGFTNTTGNVSGINIEALDAAGNNANVNSFQVSAYLNAFASVQFGGIIEGVPEAGANVDMGEVNSGPNFNWTAMLGDQARITVATSTSNPPPWTGMWTFSRTAAAVRAFYHNGSLVANDTTAQSGAFGTIRLMGGVTGGLQPPAITTRLVFYASGRGLTAAQEANLNARTLTLLTAIGAN